MTRAVHVAALVLVLAGPAQAQPFIPALRVDQIPAHQGQTFVLAGAVLDFDLVHVWAFPPSGPVFLGASSADKVDRTLQRPSGGFELLVRNAPTGTYPIVVYAHDPIFNTFPVQWVQTFTVHPCVKTVTAVRWIPRFAFHDSSRAPFGYQFHQICTPDSAR
jgi:hypothetical protein